MFLRIDHIPVEDDGCLIKIIDLTESPIYSYIFYNKHLAS